MRCERSSPALTSSFPCLAPPRKRGPGCISWLHQEVGYAIGVSVPIVPIIVGDVKPMAFLQPLQAVRIKDTPAELRQILSPDVIARRVESAARSGHASFESVYEPEARAQTIARYARMAMQRGGGRVLEQGAMSSFALPEQPSHAAVWQLRDGNVQRSAYLHAQQYEERMALGELVRRFGCSLILDPTVPLTRYGPEARRIRLTQLMTFIRDDKACPDLRIAIRPWNDALNLVIVDDWFCGESVTPQDGGGYRHTLFTWHAPTVAARIAQFEAELAGCEISRREAGSRIEAEIASIG